MKLLKLAAAFLVTALAFAAGAADIALPKGVTRGPSVEGITEYDLANGLRVLFAPEPSKPTGQECPTTMSCPPSHGPSPASATKASSPWTSCA